jgi:hypothetical protein
MNISKTLAVGIFLSACNTFSQGTILFKTYLDSTQAVPPNSSTRTAEGEFYLYPDRSFTGDIFVPDYVGITTVSLFRATGVSDSGAKLFELAPGAIEHPRPGGGGGGQIFELDTSVNLTAAQTTDLQSGLWWVSVITPEYPNGEIRGQITTIPEPSMFGLMAVGSLLLSVAIGGAYLRGFAKTKRLVESMDCVNDPR